MMKPEYMPCPFCGMIQLYIVRTSDRLIDEGYVECSNCGARGPTYSLGVRDSEDIVGRWNMRVLTKADLAPYLHMNKEHCFYPLNADMGSDVW